MLPPDKLLHALVGATLYAIALPFGHHWAVGLVFLAAIGKEVYDQAANAYARRQGLPAPHSVDVADAAATVIGGACFAGLSYIAWHLAAGTPPPLG